MEAEIRSVVFVLWILVIATFIGTCSTCHMEDRIDGVKDEIRNMGAGIESELKNIRDVNSVDYDTMRGIRRDLSRIADELGKIRYEYTKE